ncbi:hypothetical protein GCM10023196_083250 [Actinoallomurus vinaceus]|uniref:HEAT repeat domain-containing protein n=1 Tax=Actinoallomurus vinaceus TaxID=1080074 RepID=A0ABP8US87_9ACTN
MTEPNVIDNAGAVAYGNTIGGDLRQNVTVYQYVQEFIRARRLDGERIEALLRAYVPPRGRDRAAEVLGHRNAVALIGKEGTGRRTTAVHLLAQRGLTLRELAPDEEDGALPCEPGCGYLFNADSLGPGVDLEDHVVRLREQGSALAVWTTRDVRRDPGTFLADIGVELEAPEPERVFRTMLDAETGLDEAAWWRARPELEPLVKNALPGDVRRLVSLITKTMALRGCDDTAVGDLIDAYRNWDTYLQERFAKPDLDLRTRVLLITVAMLEGAPEAVVYEAATALGELLDLGPGEGRGLAGAGVRGLSAASEVTRDADGTVRFAKPAFATSVLDYTWQVYPLVQEQMRTWATALPGRLRTGDDAVLARLARTLADLADRQRDLVLIQEATADWAAAPGTRPFAVEALVRAALAPGIGRRTRRWMYDCAYDRRRPDAILSAIAEACGQYGSVYPENALTRLRHLAAADSEQVRRAVREAVTRLAGNEQHRMRVLGVVVTSAKSPKSATAFCGAFLDIVATRDTDGRLTMLDEAASGRSRRFTSMLSQGWQAALINPATADRTREVIAAWLDDALFALRAGDAGRTRAHTVIGVLGRAADGDARYLPRLVRAVNEWHDRADGSETRTALRQAVISIASSADPLAPATERKGAA